MIFDAIIRRMRARCPIFEGRVAGAAEVRAWADAKALKTPYALVIPMGTAIVSDDTSWDRPRQTIVAHRYQVQVTQTGYLDERNQKAVSSFEAIRDSIIGALVYWRPALHVHPIRLEACETGEQSREYSGWIVNIRVPQSYSSDCANDVGLTPDDKAVAAQHDLEDWLMLSPSGAGQLKPGVQLVIPPDSRLTPAAVPSRVVVQLDPQETEKCPE